MLYQLNTPLSIQDIIRLKCGDEVLLSGTLITARDKAHEFLVRRAVKDELPFDLDGACLYHCGPLVTMKKSEKSLHNDRTSAKIIAAGPTTSSRMEPYTTEIIRRYGVRMIIGKGGMDESTRRVLKKRAVYCAAVGGASQVLARAVKSIKNVYGLREFGETDAFWVLRVKDFPVIVTMDARGESLHENIKKNSVRRFKELMKRRVP